MFLDTLKGLISCFYRKKPVSAFRAKKNEVSVLMCIVHGLRYQKVSVQVTHPAPATAHVPISHLPPQQLCPHGAERDQDSI